ncbi:translation initiation factor IF-2 N-terminal domain-containing protein [Nostoc sp. TCL26-01]|uniref:translation initiation factor IF-2 N-terminal domain-containing protein n=1 Tax=Nostoc sp. TCL26-01 TaxID=2576904 RepID=UPI0015B8DA48|nr:translation initiation factor IF-2 N-terminal domain-containing protein [Nostoc sp. TCL26-01]QLE55140.1 DNA helicase [Nostoc sp. TCL26-01]
MEKQSKIRIYELSKELNLDSKKLLKICERLKIIAKTQSSTILESDAERIRRALYKLAAAKSDSLKNKINSEDWSYTFIGSTVDSLLRHFDSQKNIASYSEAWQKRERANELMFEFCGQKSCLFYVRRQGEGKEAGEQIWELVIATDHDEIPLPARLKELGKTLGLIAAVQKDGYGGLKILSAQLLPLARGQADAYTVAYRLRLLANNQHQIGIPLATLTRIRNIPVGGDHVPTEEQLKAWKVFLQVEEKIAKARQFCIVYIDYNLSSKRRLSLTINITSATLDGNQENYLDEDNFWQRVKQARNEELKLFNTNPVGKNWYSGCQLGTIEEVDIKRGIISVRLERDLSEHIAAERYQIPDNGFLFFQAVGDIQQIQRKKKALEDLNNGRTQNPYLGNFLFAAAQARPIKKTVELQPQDLLLSSANPGQKAAVETVLSAKDLVLIQGPPGTGKTTVIAEICYQIALRGGRTLIASQANLAVDNALSRLVHNPVIRAIRKGRAEKVGEEGQPFLEDQVIGTWLQNTATDCDHNLSQRRENIQIFRQLLTSSPRFTDYLKAETEFNQQQAQLKQTQAELELNFRHQEATYQESVAKKSEVEFLNTGLETLLSNTQNINWEAPEVTNLLPLLKPYTEGHSLVDTFLAQVRTAIKYTDELGLVRPGCGAFGLAVWLRETVEAKLAELKTTFTYASDAITAMAEVASSAEIFKQKSHHLHQLQTDYQQLLTKQQKLQPNLQIWENRQREIDYIISAVTEWKSTAFSTLYQALKECQKSHQPFTEPLTELPLGLLMFAGRLKITIVPNHYHLNLPDWALLTKALAYEIEGGFSDRRGNKHNFSYFVQQNFSQTPMVLSKSDRTQWQEIYQQFANYQLLNQNQRKLLVENTQIFLVRMQQTYSKAWEIDHLDATLTRMTQELLDSILVNARKCVLQIKTETDQQLQYLKTQLSELPENNINQSQIVDVQHQVEIASQDANTKLEQTVNILQTLQQQPNSPTKLQILVDKYLTKQSNIWEQSEEFTQQINAYTSAINQLESLIVSLEPFTILEMIKKSLQEHLAQLNQTTEVCRQELAQLQSKISELAKQSQPKPSPQLISDRKWWQILWQTIPDRLKHNFNANNLFNLDLLHNFKIQLTAWQEQLKNEENYLHKYQDFVQDWIAKVRDPSERDRHDLRRIYLDNSNVVGITCVQAASKDFSEEFNYFDVVIIDEVSKCTPPELLIPALKAKKLVLVGDHRQLPPMLDTSTLAEVAEEINTTKAELQFLEESLFKSQFETADHSIKQMLTTQYRMHPNIMGAINQFYDDKLECGIAQPDIKRAHNLSGKIIQPNHHLVWVTMPKSNDFQEQREGTSFFNHQEIDAIDNLCQQFENTWSEHIINGEPQKEIAVITFYGAQLRKIEERLQSELFPSLQIRTGTVDRFQGMERPVVIVSMVRNNSKGDVGFAKKPERVNVAFSRAQELLIIVGCHDLFTHQPGKIGQMYSQVSDIVHDHGGLIDVSRFID